MDDRLQRALLSPRRIAIVGASADPAKAGSRPLRYLVEGGYAGEIYPVNPRVAEIDGVKCWPSIADLPEAPDLAFVLLPADAAVEAAAECAKAGVGMAMILAAGFAESGHEGQQRQDRLARIARESGMRILGPSCLGLANFHENAILTGNAAFAESGQVPGGIFCASQSGSMIGALLSRGRAKGVNFAGLISVGGEVDVTIGELCEATLDDPRITSYMLFLETIRGAAAIRRFAIGAAARGKPVVALKLGRSRAAAELATSHTGGLAGEDDVADAFLADCGIARVETLEALLESAALMRAPVSPGGGRVGVVTTTGGGAAMVVDQLGMRDVTVDGPDAKTLAAIRATGVDIGSGRIADLTMAGVKYDVMKGALEAMLASDQYEKVVAVVGSSARFQPEITVKPIIDIGKLSERLAVFVVPEAPEAVSMLSAAGIAVFRTPESCADAVATALRRRAPRQLDLPAPRDHGDTILLDEVEGYAMLSQLGIASAPAIAVRTGQPAPDAGYFPAAVKILARDIAHKTELGGVVLGVKTPEDFAEAVQRIGRSVSEKSPSTALERVVVQQMVTAPVGEILLGYRVDPQVGPLIMVAAGGTMTELIRDRSLRMAPVDLETARQMLGELKSLPLLTGYRGKPSGDVEALAEAIVALSQLALRPEVAELEINPLMVMRTGEGVRAVDVVVHIDRD